MKLRSSFSILALTLILVLTGQVVGAGGTSSLPSANSAAFGLIANPATIDTVATVPGVSSILVLPANFSTTVSLAVMSTLPSGCTVEISATNTFSITCANGQPQFVVVVTGTRESFTASTRFFVTIEDFAVSPSSSTTIDAFAGIPATQGITVTSTSAFPYTITLRVFPPTGLTCLGQGLNGFGSTFGGDFAFFNLECTGLVAGDFPLVVNATGGPLTRATGVITFHVQDFAINSHPSVITLANGREEFRSLIMVSGSNGFTGTITLSANASPTNSFALALFPANITLSRAETSGHSMLSFLLPEGTAIPSGTFTITVTGTSGDLSHSTVIEVMDRQE